MSFYEACSGARLHAAFFAVGNSSSSAYSMTDKLWNELKFFCSEMFYRLDELEDLLTDNFIWVSRLRNVGVISIVDSIRYSFSGPVLRSCGVP